MNIKKKDTSEELNEPKQKTCFAIMPIADHPDYPPGHFTRVYNHLIKPACEKAGYKVVRADDAKSSHMIMFDILKNIVECDMAICDLSSKNANVFYELGLRQAFNKKTILITDELTNTPFDISGFRYVKYSESLRIDTVLNDINEIAGMLIETDKSSEDDINSIVNLLRIQPASVNKVELNAHESVLYDLIRNLDAKVSAIYTTNKNKPTLSTDYKTPVSLRKSWLKSPFSGMSFIEFMQKYPNVADRNLFRNDDVTLGYFKGHNDNGDLVFVYDELTYYVANKESELSKIFAV